MLTPDGQVKLLDFGLAHAVITPEGITRDVGRGHPTARGHASVYGARAGGSASTLTTQTDLFSLGAVLFQCLSGELPFEGKSVGAYEEHLLSSPPKLLGRLRPETPPAIVRLITQCLAKRAEERPLSAAEVAAGLRQSAQNLTASTPSAARRALPLKVRPLWLLLATAVVLVVAVVFAIQRWTPSSGPPERVLRPFVTWPSDEVDSRGSPDGRWISFLSNRDGATALFVQAIDAVDARKVTLARGSVVSHLWSPNGQEYACAMQLTDGLFLQVFPAPLGGAAKKSFRLQARAAGVRLLRWIENAIYLETRNEKTGRPVLGRIDLGAETMTPISSGWTLPASVKPDAAYTYFDVSPDGRRVVFALVTDSQEDLWLVSADGSGVSRLTNDAPFERRPIWTGRGDTVIYQSNRGGQLDLWEAQIAGGRPWQLTSDRAAELPRERGRRRRTEHLPALDGDRAPLAARSSAGEPIPLTNDALSDLAPSVSRDGKTIVFQRTNSSSLAGNTLLDSRLIKGTLVGQTLRLEPEFAAEGFAPQISPDGAEASPTCTARRRRSSSRISAPASLPPSRKKPRRPPSRRFRNSWLGQNVAWVPTTGDLVFVERSPLFKISRYSAGKTLDVTPIVQVERGWRVRDLFPSADGRTLAYLKSASDAHELHTVDLGTRADRLPRASRRDISGIVFRAGLPRIDRSAGATDGACPDRRRRGPGERNRDSGRRSDRDRQAPRDDGQRAAQHGPHRCPPPGRVSHTNRRPGA